MPPLPESKKRNVVASIFSYIATNFTYVVDFAGAGVEEEDADEWARMDVMFPTPVYARQVGDNTFGANALAMLNANFFKKQEVHEKNPYVFMDKIDEFENLFRVPLGIPIMDHAGTPGNRIGTLQTSVLESREMPMLNAENNLYAKNVTSTMRFVLEWEEPS